MIRKLTTETAIAENRQWMQDHYNAMRDAEREACVNACVGLNPEAIPALIEALGQASKPRTPKAHHMDMQRVWAALAAVRGEK